MWVHHRAERTAELVGAGGPLPLALPLATKAVFTLAYVEGRGDCAYSAGGDLPSWS